MNEPWVKVTSPVTGGTTFRARSTLERVIEAHLREGSPLRVRYLPRDLGGGPGKETCCNYLVSDVTRALGCEVPTHVQRPDGSCVSLRAREQLAWLQAVGAEEHGWSECSPESAVARAALGYPCVVAWAGEEAHAHIAVVAPNRPGDEGPHIAQAGASVFFYGPVAAGFGTRGPLRYFTHS